MGTLRSGITTGTCAAVAAKAATMALLGNRDVSHVEVNLPDGSRVNLPVLYARKTGDNGEAAVKKDAGDDPDITDGVDIVARVSWTDSGGISFAAGDGVGIVTKPGLSMGVGEPAINPVPRRMIMEALQEITERSALVTISIPNGKKLAEKTFNPRLGIAGGLSILGTTGLVRPFSHPALQTALKCSLDVAIACDIKTPILVPGHIGERAARRHFKPSAHQVIEVSNEWGFMVDLVAACLFSGLLVLGHPGKLTKLIYGDWDTHSSRSKNALPFVRHLAEATFGRSFPETTTVDGFFANLSDNERVFLGDKLACNINWAVADRIKNKFPTATVIVNIRGEWLGSSGEVEPWR